MVRRNVGFSFFLVLFASLLTGCGPSESASAAAGSAMDVTGTVTGSVGEVSEQWETLKMDVDGQIRATASFGSPVGVITDFTLQAHLGRQFTIKDSVSITFTLMNGQVQSGGVLYFPEAGMTPHYGDHEDSVTVTLDSIELQGDTAQVKGRAVGQLYHVSSYTASPDTTDAVTVDLVFNATAYKENF